MKMLSMTFSVIYLKHKTEEEFSQDYICIRGDRTAAHGWLLSMKEDI